MGLVPPRPGYLAALRELTEKDGCLLVFDEVMTGFRVAYGGAQELYGITPDLTALGKVVGGGLPAAAYGASAAIMDHVSPVGPIYQAGTLSGKSSGHGRRAGDADLLRDEPPYDRLEALAARLAEGLDRAATDAGIPHVVQRTGSMLTLFFHDGPVHDYDDARGSDTRLFARFFWEMLARGIYLPCSQFEAAFVSAAHTDDDIDRTIEAAGETLRVCRG